MEAIGDLRSITPCHDFDRPSNLSTDNVRRVRYLIENDLWDLPDSERPVCHQDGTHTYPSVYGRIHPDEPAQTLTTGFLSPGRGRFTHPSLARGLTLHEGARLQGFPDDFQFNGRRMEAVKRNALSKLIGDAVPPQLGYVTGLAALSTL
jgi:DNA (cytosine-5)-methyltransferase 1